MFSGGRVCALERICLMAVGCGVLKEDLCKRMLAVHSEW